MALIGNRSVLHKSPGRFLAGTVASGDRSNFSKHGMLRGALENFSRLSAWPNGHLSPSAWVLPQVAGGMSSRNVTTLSLAAVGAGAAGVNISGAADMSITATGTAQLIASAIGSATFTVTATGSVKAVLSASGAATFALSTSGTIGALAWGQGAASMQVTATLTAFATGNMRGSTADASTLTADQVAVAVWNYTQ